jgi:mRNA-degrading endonuclease YafQ of YafQ-DinJ toxin-antitoxin module
MEIKTSSGFEEKVEKLCRKNKPLGRLIDQKLRILSVFPKHPSLRLHKIESKFDAWSISVNPKLRILFVYRSYGILLVDIGSHDQVY